MNFFPRVEVFYRPRPSKEQPVVQSQRKGMSIFSIVQQYQRLLRFVCAFS